MKRFISNVLLVTFTLMISTHRMVTAEPANLSKVQAVTFKIELEIPRIETDAYFRPYVAVWLESEQREPIQTLALWYQTESLAMQEDGGKWLKDLRQWWRKIGRNEQAKYDSVTGATRRPGQYKIVWHGQSVLLTAKNYFINFEAAREEGGRTFHRLPFSLDPSLKQQTIIIPAEHEFGEITIKLESQ